MANMVKDLSEDRQITVNGKTTAHLRWKTTAGNTKGLMGKVKAAKEIDLDLQAVLYGVDGPKDLCYHANTDPTGNASVVLGGDAGAGGLLGAAKRFGKTDKPSEEEMTLDLAAVPPWCKAIVVLVSAFKDGVSITDAESVELRLTDGSTEIFFKPTITDNGNTCLMAKLARQPDNSWVATPVNKMVTAHSKGTMLAAADRV